MDQPCVLVVDDDREIVRAIAKLLELEGYRVLRAYNGMEAMDVNDPECAAHYSGRHDAENGRTLRHNENP